MAKAVSKNDGHADQKTHSVLETVPLIACSQGVKPQLERKIMKPSARNSFCNSAFRFLPVASTWTHISAMAITCGLMLGQAARAANVTWEGDDGTSPTDWTVGANWAGGLVPTSSDTVIFNDTATGTTVAVLNNSSVSGFEVNGTKSFNFTPAAIITVNGAFTKTTSGTVTMGAAPRHSIQGTDFQISNSGAGLLDLNGDLFKIANTTGDASGNVVFSGGYDIEVDRLRKRRGYQTTSIVKNGGGTLTITSFETTFSTTGTNNSGFTNDTTVNAGAIRVTSGDQRSLGQSGVASATWLTLNGGALQVSTANLILNHANGGVYLGASDGTFNVDASRTLTIGGGGATNIITGAVGGDLIKTGSGTLSLADVNTYTGTTIINNGTLALGASGAINNTSGVVLGGGTFDVTAKGGSGYNVANLSGNGSVAGTINVTTSLNIGGDSNTATINFGNVALTGSTITVFDLTGGSSTADLGDVSGTLDLAGATLDLVQLGSYTNGDKFTLFAYDGTLSNTFSGLADGDTFTDAGGLWQIDYNDPFAGLNGGVSSSNTYVTITATAVPEPGAALLGGIGVLLLLRRRR